MTDSSWLNALIRLLIKKKNIFQTYIKNERTNVKAELAELQLKTNVSWSRHGNKLNNIITSCKSYWSISNANGKMLLSLRCRSGS